VYCWSGRIGGRWEERRGAVLRRNDCGDKDSVNG
jgi:hypothetical protein